MAEPVASFSRLAPGLGRKRYAAWLRVGLQQFFFEEKGALSFLGLGENYGKNPSIGEDIVDAVQKLPAKDREDFREATVDVIRQTPLDIEPLYLEALLIIAAGLQARGALEAIAQKSFTLRPGESTNTILRYCFEFARDLALSEGPGAEQCLKHITSQSAFPPAFSGQALEALTAANPDHFAEHFRHLQEKLDIVYADCNADRDELIRLRERRRLLVQSIRKYNIQYDNLINGLKLDCRKVYSGEIYWWIEAITSEIRWNELRTSLIEQWQPHVPEADFVAPDYDLNFEDDLTFEDDAEVMSAFMGEEEGHERRVRA